MVGLAAAGQPAPGRSQRNPTERADFYEAVSEPGVSSARHAEASSAPAGSVAGSVYEMVPICFSCGR